MEFLHNIDWVVPFRTPALTSAAFAVTWLGYSTFIMFVMAVGYWAWSKAIFFRVMLLIGFSAVFNAYVKDLFQDARPALALRLDDLVGTSYGLPSGHSQLAVVMWLWLAYEIRQTWAWVLCSTIAVSVCVSRLYLGAHDLEDVLSGASLGALTLIIFARIKDRKWAWQTNAVWSIAGVWLVAGAMMLTWRSPGTPPDYVATLAGWATGGILGLKYEERILNFSVSPVWWRKLISAILGIVGFIALQKLLELIDVTAHPPSLFWDPLKGIIIGFFIALPMPWVLSKFGLVTKKT